MDSVLIESPMAAARSPSFRAPVFSPPNYDAVLKDSIDRFLGSVHGGTLDFSAFRSIFSRFIQSSADPPVEVIWFYSAVNHHESVSPSAGPLDRVAAVRNLLQYLAFCSSSCGGAKSVAMLAPAVSLVHGCLVEEAKVEGKEGKKLRKEIEALIEGILSYISICNGKSWDGGNVGDGLLPCFRDLVRVWTVGRSCKGSDLGVFFPLVSEEISQRFDAGCGVGYLAGVVIVEAFLLRLCLKVRAAGGSREELQKELRIWAISSVTAFQNHLFFEILLRLLLDRTLPIVSLLDSKDENLVRDILYDIVTLVDYSFLNKGMNCDQSYDYIRCLAIRRLLVFHDAIRIAREKGDHTKAISYVSAFSTSNLPHQIIKWVASLTGTENLKKPDINTPQVVLDWLVSLEDQGLRFFEDNTQKLGTKLVLGKPKASDGKVTGDKGLFFIDKGQVADDEEMDAADDSAFLAVARSMATPASNGRKRKGAGGKEHGGQVKFVKHKVHESSMRDYTSPVADSVSSGSEVDNPPSDDEMEEN